MTGWSRQQKPGNTVLAGVHCPHSTTAFVVFVPSHCCCTSDCGLVRIKSHCEHTGKGMMVSRFPLQQHPHIDADVRLLSLQNEVNHGTDLAVRVADRLLLHFAFAALPLLLVETLERERAHDAVFVHDAVQAAGHALRVLALAHLDVQRARRRRRRPWRERARASGHRAHQSQHIFRSRWCFFKWLVDFDD